MRRIGVVVIVAGLLAAPGVAHAASGATVDAQCTFSGLLDFHPGVNIHARPETITLDTARIEDDAPGGSCPLALASVAGSLHTTALSCPRGPYTFGAPATGTMTITWSDESTSVLQTSLSSVPQSETRRHWGQFVFTGRVVSGPYVGDHFAARADHIQHDGRCIGPAKSPITQTSFFAYNDYRGEKELTFSH